MSRLSLYLAVIFVSLHFFAVSETYADEWPTNVRRQNRHILIPPKEGAKCSFPRAIERPKVYAQIDFLGVSVDIALRRRISFKIQDNNAVQFNEEGIIALSSKAINRLVDVKLAPLRANMRESCQLSISSLSGSTFAATPPTFQIYSDGKARKCTSFDVPCGYETRCDANIAGVQVCYPSAKMCRVEQSVDVGNWKIAANGRLLLGKSDGGDLMQFSSTIDNTSNDSQGSGFIADLLEQLGLLKLFTNITGSTSSVEASSFPTTGKLFVISSPANVIGTPQLNQVSWVSGLATEADRFSQIGISYSQSVKFRRSSACRASYCLARTQTDDDYLKCFVSN